MWKGSGGEGGGEKGWREVLLSEVYVQYLCSMTSLYMMSSLIIYDIITSYI